MVAAAVVLFVLAYSYQIRDLDRRVRDKQRWIVSMIELDGGSVEFGFEEFDLREFETSDGGWYLQVWVDGESEFRSATLEDHELELPTPGETVAWIDLPGAAPGRGLFHVYDLRHSWQSSLADADDQLLIQDESEDERPEISVFMARDAGDVLAALRYLAVGLTVITGVGLLVMAAILTAVVTRSMRPVEELAERIKRIDATDLDASIRMPTLPTELEPIVVQFNALLARLESAFERERGFCADVAHELRTPLAGLRTTLEVTQARTRTDEQYARAIDQCKLVVVQTQGLVDSLLQIARLESGQNEMRPEWIDLNATIQSTWQDVAAKAPAPNSYQLSWKLATDAEVWADQAVLEVVLRNLFDNAIEYVDEHGAIEIESAMTPDGARIVIANSGCRVEPEDADKVFDRFWRGSNSRAGTGSHFGLGLSLAQRAAVNLGGTLTVQAEFNAVFRAICFLPQSSNTVKA